MKKLMILSVMVLVTILAACTKLKRLADINIDIPYNQEVNIPRYSGGISGLPIPGGGAQLPFPAIPVATNSKQYIAQYNTSAEKVLRIDLKSLQLQILEPNDQN